MEIKFANSVPYEELCIGETFETKKGYVYMVTDQQVEQKDEKEDPYLAINLNNGYMVQFKKEQLVRKVECQLNIV